MTDIHGPRRDSQGNKKTSRLDDVCPDMWKHMSDAARINAKNVLIRQDDDERDYEFRAPTLLRETTVRREDLTRELHGEPGVSQPTEPTDDAEARADFWSIQGGFIFRHHNEPRVQLYVPKEETFPIPRKYIDVSHDSWY